MKVLREISSLPFMAFLLVLLFWNSAYPGILSGTVIDDFYFDPVPDVEVTVYHSDSTLAGIDTTGIDGIYSLTLDAAEYYALFTKVNYADTVISDITVTPEGTTIIDLTFDFIGVCEYVVGDVNGSGNLNGLDVTYGINYFKYGYPEPSNCLCECTPGHSWYVCGDVNESCTFNALDITFLIRYTPGGPVPTPCPDCPPVIWDNGR